MSDLVVALGLVLVIEGAVYALFPDGMKRVMSQAIEIPAPTLRAMGLGAAVLGLLVVWLVRG